VHVAVSGLERTEIVVKGSTHWDCRVEVLKENTSIYEGADRDQLMGSNTASVRRMKGGKAVLST
jgi:hypothetical protein